MAAGINDKFKKVSADNSYAVATTVKTARTVGGGTTLEAFDLSKWADATAVNFLTYRKTTDPVTNITTVTNRTGWTALVNTGSNTLTNLTIAPGYSDLGHQAGDYIEPVQMSKWANDLVDGILVTHNQDGTLKDNAVSTAKIGNNQVTTAKIGDAQVTASKLDFATFYNARGNLQQQTLTTSAVNNTTITIPTSVRPSSIVELNISIEYNNSGGPLKDMQCDVLKNGTLISSRFAGATAGVYFVTGQWLDNVTVNPSDTLTVRFLKTNANTGGEVVARSTYTINQVG